MVSDDQIIAVLRRRIEAQLNWGSAEKWTTSEFQELSDLIAESTSISLSPTTLKRVWGRVNYASQPSTTTLNALALFAGHDHWRAFFAAESEQAEMEASEQAIPITPATVEKPLKEAVGTPQTYLPLLGVAGLALLALLFYQLFAPAAAPETTLELSAEDYHLSFRPVTSGVPNSVVFKYDAKQAPTEEVYLQQSWDPIRREKLDRERNTHTSIYYLPGFYRAKLVVGDQVLVEKELYLRSDDWVAAVDAKPVPVYLPLEEVRAEGRLAITEAQLTGLGLNLQPVPPKTVLTHVGAIENLWSNNFTFSTRLRHDYATGAAACQHARILLLLKNSAIVIPLSAPGCVADLQLFAGGRALNGRDTDLSLFGVVGDSWIELACTGENGLLTFNINGERVFQLESEEAPKEIIGIRYEFSGMGSVDNLLFRNDAGNAWEENF